MYSLLLRILNIKRSEVGFTFLMFLSAGILGIFLSTFDIAAHAIFLDNQELSSRDMGMVYLFSGVLGILVFTIFAQAYKRLSAKVFYFINLLIVLSGISLYLYFYIFHTSLLTSFFGLVIMFPVNLLAILNFWRYLRKLLYPEQSRRLLPVVEFGFILGVVSGGLLVLMMLMHVDYFVIPLISFIAVLTLFFFQFPINQVHSRKKIFNYKKEKFVPVKNAILLIFSTKYTLFLFAMALIASVIGFLIHFGFISMARQSFDNSISLSKFYGLFIGIMYLFILFISRFLVRKVLYSYDSPYSLVLLPVALFFLLLPTFAVFMIFSNLTAIDRFTFIFILIGMNKIVFETSLYIIQTPSLRTLYRTLDIRFSQIIIPRIEGTVVMLGMLIAGGILIGLMSVKLSPTRGAIIVSLLLSPLWFYFAIKVIKAYKKALQESYRKLRISRSYEPISNSYNEKIREILVGEDPGKVINAMRLSARIEPLAYERSLQRMLAHPNPDIQNYVLTCIEHESLIDLLPELKKIIPTSKENKELLARIVYEFGEKHDEYEKGHDIESLVSSRKLKDRLLAAEIIGTRKDTTYTSALMNLTREFEPDVKIAAVKAMARMSNADHSYMLIEFLNYPEYHAYAFEALVEIGEPALEYLERLFLNPNAEESILSTVVRIYGNVGTAKAIDLLLNKLENQSRRVTQEAIFALHETNFQASSLNVHKILNNVVRVIQTLGWNYLIFNSLPDKEKYFSLRMAFSREIEMNYDLLYDLLSLAYNARTLHEIRELLEHGSQPDISHAIEMLDHFVFEDIKPVLFPIFENISNEERVKRLQYYFPIETMKEDEMISFILTRDYNLLSIYPRVCAMELALTMQDFEVSQELIANMFHPNMLLREVAAMVTHSIDIDLFNNVIQRLDESIQHEIIDTLSAISTKEKMLLIDKFNIIRNMNKFSDLSEDLQITLAQSFTEKKFKEGQHIDLKRNVSEYSLLIINGGELELNGNSIPASEDHEYQVFYSNILINYGIESIIFTGETTVLSIDDHTIQMLLFDFSEIANCMLSCIEEFKIAG